MENGDFSIFMNTSIQKTNSQTVFFFLLTNAQNTKFINVHTLTKFLKNSDLVHLFDGFQTQDYQIFNLLMRHIFKNEPSGAYESFIQHLFNQGMRLKWLTEDDAFLNSYDEIVATGIQTEEQLAQAIYGVKQACCLLDSSFGFGNRTSNKRQKYFGFQTIQALNKLKEEFPIYSKEIGDVVFRYFQIQLTSGNSKRINNLASKIFSKEAISDLFLSRNSENDFANRQAFVDVDSMCQLIQLFFSLNRINKKFVLENLENALKLGDSNGLQFSAYEEDLLEIFQFTEETQMLKGAAEMILAYFGATSSNYEVLALLKKTLKKDANYFVSYCVYSGLTQMIGESVNFHKSLNSDVFQSVNTSINKLHFDAGDRLVLNAPEFKLLYFKALSYADPKQFTLEFEKHIKKSLLKVQKNKLLLFLGNKIQEKEIPFQNFETDRAERAALVFVDRALKEKDFINYWNSGLNIQSVWKAQENVLPIQPVYFKNLLMGVNDRLAYKLEKTYVLKWERENKRKMAARQSKQVEKVEEEDEESKEDNIKFNLDYFSQILNHKDFELTLNDIILNDMDKILNAYILEQ